MVEAPILKFREIEEVLRELPYPNAYYKKMTLNEFYRNLFAACRQKIENLHRVSIPLDISRERAEQKYREVSNYYIQEAILL